MAGLINIGHRLSAGVNMIPAWLGFPVQSSYLLRFQPFGTTMPQLILVDRNLKGHVSCLGTDKVSVPAKSRLAS